MAIFSDDRKHLVLGLTGAALSVSFALFMWRETTPWAPVRPLIYPAATEEPAPSPLSSQAETPETGLPPDPIVTSSLGPPMIARHADPRAQAALSGDANARTINRKYRLVGVYGDVALLARREGDDGSLWFVRAGGKTEIFGDIRLIDTRVHPPLVVTSSGLIVP